MSKPYEVLALKYRPKVFEDLVGQEAVTRTLTSAIQRDRIAHAFLFAGVRGVGKTTTARILAKALNCVSGPTVRPCGECPACKEIALGRSMDVLEIDGASHTKVEEFRELLETVQYSPSRDRFKIYIVDEVHMLSTHSFNALLKTLEEPPPHVKFIFATTEHHKIPDTILSRCQEFEFRIVSLVEIGEQLRKIAKAENIEISDAALHAIARTAEGSLRDGISALDQVVAATGERIEEADVTELLGIIERDVLRETTRAIVESDTPAILNIVDGLVRGGRDLRYFTSALMQFLRDVLVVRVAPQAPDLLEIPAEVEELEKLGAELSEEDLLRSLDVLTQTETSLRLAPDPRFHLEMALLKISQLRRLESFEELLARFEALASGEPPPPSSSGPPPAKKLEVESSAPVRDREKESTSPPGGDRTERVPPLGEGTSPPPPAPTGDGLVPALLEQLKGSKPMLHAIVSHHHQAEVKAEELVLTYLSEQKVLAEQLEQKDLRDLLEEQIASIAGTRLSVRVIVTEHGGEVKESSAESAPPAREENDASLEERARRDQMVQRFVDTFQGEVEDVRPID